MSARQTIARVLLDAAAEEFAAAVRTRAVAEDEHVQDSEPVRVVAAGAGEVDVVRYEDELAVAAQNDCSRTLGEPGETNPVSNAIGTAPRSAAYAFTVGRAVEVGAVELLLHQWNVGGLGAAGTGVAWFSIWSGDPKPTVYVGILGGCGAGFIAHDSECLRLIQLAEGDEISLTPGVQYWLVIGGADPGQETPPDEDQWITQGLWCRKLEEVGAGICHKDTSAGGKHRPPYAEGEYSVHTDLGLWFRLYERRHTIKSVPIAPGVTAPSVGEQAVMGQIGGQHPLRHIIPGQGGRGSATGVARGRGGGLGTSGTLTEHNALPGIQGGKSTVPREFHHLTQTEYETGDWGHHLKAIISDAATDTVVHPLIAKHVTDGEMADGFGAGVLFQVEDATSGPQTLGGVCAVRNGADNTGALSFRVANAGALTECARLAPGQATVYGELDVIKDADRNQELLFTNYADTYSYHRPTLSLLRARGTLASPAAVVSGDYLGQLRFGGHDGAGFEDTADIRALANENFDATHEGTRLEFYTTANAGTSPSLALTIEHNANITAEGLIRAANGTVAAPTYSFSGATAYGMYYASASLRWAIGGVAELILSATALYPATAGGLDFGSTSKEIADVFIASDKYIFFGDGQVFKMGWNSSENRGEIVAVA